jgi:hypothetical protein
MRLHGLNGGRLVPIGVGPIDSISVLLRRSAPLRCEADGAAFLPFFFGIIWFQFFCDSDHRIFKIPSKNPWSL